MIQSELQEPTFKTDKNSVDLTLCARWVYTSPAPDLNHLKNKVKIETCFTAFSGPELGLAYIFPSMMQKRQKVMTSGP